MLKKLLILPTLLLVMNSGAFADVCNPDDPDYNMDLCDGPGTGTTPINNDEGVPLDGGASILLATGAGFAYRKLRANRNKK